MRPRLNFIYLDFSEIVIYSKIREICTEREKEEACPKPICCLKESAELERQREQTYLVNLEQGTEWRPL